MPNLDDILVRLKCSFRMFAARRPWLLFGTYRHLQWHKNLLVGPGTQLVLERYPRSSNTFALHHLTATGAGA